MYVHWPLMSRVALVLLGLAIAGCPSGGTGGGGDPGGGPGPTPDPSRVFYVDTASKAGAEDGSRDFPFNTISEALALTVADRSDGVIVRSGTYPEGLVLKAGVLLVGQEGAHETFLTGPGKAVGPIVTLADKATFRGFSVGGATGTAVLAPAGATVRIENCVLHSSGTGLQAGPGASVVFANNTVYGNGAGVSGDVSAAFTVLRNSIFARNDAAILSAPLASNATYNNYYLNTANIVGSAPGITDLAVDPMFVSEAILDLRLDAPSLCRDAGDPALAYNDLDGSRNDMGANGGPYGASDAAEMIEPSAGGRTEIDDTGNSIDGAWVEMPANAVATPVVLTITEGGPLAPTLLGTVQQVEIGPSGTQFAQPVTVSLPLPQALTASQEPVVLSMDPATSLWSRDGISNVRYVAAPVPTVLFETTHLTYFDVLATWTVTEVPTIGGIHNYAFSINNGGDVAGYSYLFAGANWRRAFLWDSTGVLENLGLIDSTAKHSYGFAVNNAGKVAGYNQPLDESDDFRAFLWSSGGGMQDLGDLGGNQAVAKGINSSTEVCGYATLANGDTTAFLWDSTDGMQDLGDLGRAPSYAFGMNDSTEVVGGSQKNPSTFQAFVWDSGSGMQSLANLPSGKYGFAFDINGSSQVVGESENSSAAVRAVLWDGGVTDLGTLGGTDSRARAINNSTQVVGYSDTASDAAVHAFGWDNTGTPAMTDLNDLLPGGSGWVLTDAWDINNDGDIVGVGELNGDTRGFLLEKS